MLLHINWCKLAGDLLRRSVPAAASSLLHAVCPGMMLAGTAAYPKVSGTLTTEASRSIRLLASARFVLSIYDRRFVSSPIFVLHETGGEEFVVASYSWCSWLYTNYSCTQPIEWLAYIANGFS